MYFQGFAHKARVKMTGLDMLLQPGECLDFVGRFILFVLEIFNELCGQYGLLIIE